MYKVLLLATLIAITAPSCTKSNVSPTTNNSNNNGDDNPNHSNGNGDDDRKAKLGIEMDMVNPTNDLFRSTAGTLTFNGGTANTTLVKFEAKQGTSEVEYKLTNAGVIDLLSLNTFGNITLNAGTYNEVELKVQLAAGNSTPSLTLNGTYNGNSGNIPVTFVANEGLEIKTEQHNVTLGENTTFTAVISLDMGILVNGISSSMLENAQVTNGVIVISAGSNSALYNMIVNNLEDHHHHNEFHD